MKLTIKNRPEDAQDREFNLVLDNDGDVQLMIDGEMVMFFTPRGEAFRVANKDTLAMAPFELDPSGRLRFRS